MGLLRRLMMRAAQEFAQKPEARAKASRVLEDDVKPRAKQAWQQARPEIANAGLGLKRFANKVREEYRKGRDGE